MFDGCSSLMGGNGTLYTDSRKNLTYAVPDRVEGKPGDYQTHQGLLTRLDDNDYVVVKY